MSKEHDAAVFIVTRLLGTAQCAGWDGVVPGCRIEVGHSVSDVLRSSKSGGGLCLSGVRYFLDLHRNRAGLLSESLNTMYQHSCRTVFG